MADRDENEIGALWIKTSAKGEYMTGTINGERVVVFRTQKRSDKAPDWRVLKSGAAWGGASGARPKPEAEGIRNDGAGSVGHDDDVDIPF